MTSIAYLIMVRCPKGAGAAIAQAQNSYGIWLSVMFSWRWLST